MSDVWESVLAELKSQIKKEDYDTYIKNLKFSYDNNTKIATIITGNAFLKKNVPLRYHSKILTSLKNHGIEINDIEYTDFNNSKPKIRTRETSVRLSDIQPRQTFKPKTTNQNHLNSKFTLDTFVIGGSNEVAVHVAKSIIESPGNNRSNPFFLYGRPGLGKTHLVQAIGNEIQKVHPELNVRYTTTAEFYSTFIAHLQDKTKNTDAFRQHYRSYDVLIIDDFQQIIGKDSSQQEFFDTFNEFQLNNKQIIVTSDRLPSQIHDLDERLSSRLSSAGEYNLEMPSFEERCAILRSLADYNGDKIENEAIEYIAEKTNTNIRELCGNYTKILFYAEAQQTTPLEIIQSGRGIERNTQRSIKNIIPSMIVEKVAIFYKLEMNDICGKRRDADINHARQVTMYLLHNDLNLSNKKTALEVGRSDHTTAINGIKKITKQLDTDFNLRDDIEKIRSSIYG